MKISSLIPNYIAICVVVFIGGCTLDEDQPISTAPEVQIMSPSGATSPFYSGDRILIQVNFEDDVELHEMAVFVRNTTTDELVYQRNLHKHGSTYRWIEDTTFIAAVPTDFEITGIVTDHELQRSEEAKIFSVIPK